MNRGQGKCLQRSCAAILRVNPCVAAIEIYSLSHLDFAYLCRVTGLVMKSKQECIEIIDRHSPVLRQEFGIRSLCIFGSVARNEQKVGSDVDICVDMDAKMFLVVRLKRFLESILDSPVDVVRLRKNLNPFLKSEIERDGVYVFQ